MEQQIRFCTTSDGVRIAYATVGEGPPLVKAPNWVSHLEYEWRSPIWRHWLETFSSTHALVRYDERGNGLSDWEVPEFSFDAWVRDLETVVDTLGLERFPIFGWSQGCAVAIAYAARHPERVSHLVLLGGFIKGLAGRVLTPEQSAEWEALVTLVRVGWGREDPTYRQFWTNRMLPDATSEQARWLTDISRVSVSPENALRFIEEFLRIDVSEQASQVQVPALVLHARDEHGVPLEGGREMAAALPNARLAILDSRNHFLMENEPAWKAFVREVYGFLGVEPPPAPDVQKAGSDAALAMVLFTDIERSTTLTQRLGDAKAQELVRAHNTIVREALRAHGGSEIKHTGDGIMASFASASRGLECAITIQEAVAAAAEQTPLRVRVGVNAGEPVAEERDLFGTAVQLARRICDHAEAGQILASDVVRQLAAGKGFLFSDRGEMALRGFEDPVRLYEVRWQES